MRSRSILLSVILGFFVIFLTSTAKAVIQFSDGFNYSVGSLNTQGPPTGSPTGQGTWATSSHNPTVVNPGLTFSGVFSSGNTAAISGRDANANGDIASASLSPISGGSGIEWVGFLINAAGSGGTPGGFAVVALGNGPSIGMLDHQNLYGLDDNTGSPADTAATTTGPSSATVWLVTELDFNAGEQYLFVNPSTTSTPNIASANATLAMTSSFQSSGFSSVTLAAGFNTATLDFDELRIGTTFNDVVVPEPASVLAVGVIAGIATMNRHRYVRGVLAIPTSI